MAADSSSEVICPPKGRPAITTVWLSLQFSAHCSEQWAQSPLADNYQTVNDLTQHQVRVRTSPHGRDHAHPAHGDPDHIIPTVITIPATAERRRYSESGHVSLTGPRSLLDY